ncbi:MAG TPA: hypothetical protein VLL48_15340, partial [Longimicrobiales bacterium]|nr:hypothetical protein [Longimicrobiales bacterium]
AVPVPARDRPVTGIVQRWLLPVAVVILGALALWGWLRPEPRPFGAFNVTLDNAGAEFGPLIALAQDGSALAYVTEGAGLAVKPLSAVESRALPVEEARTPFFSPDGSALAYHTGSPEGSELRWVRLDGGGSIRVAETVYPGGSWGEDGYIYFSSDDDLSIWRVRAQGGDPERLPQPEGVEFFWPQVIDGGNRILIRARQAGEGIGRRLLGAESQLSILDPENGQVTAIDGAGLEGALYGRYAGGYLFWVDSQYNLLAARLDIGDARLSSPAVNLAKQILAGPGNAVMAVARDGTLIYSTGILAVVGLGENLAWVERDGSVEILEERWAEQIGDFDGLALGPGERYVAAQIDPPDQLQDSRQEIWILDTRQSTAYPLTFDGASYDPEWLDGRRVAYIQSEEDRTILYAQPYDRSGPEEVLLELDREIEDFEVGPGGMLLLTLQAAPDDPELPRGLYVVEPDDPATLRPFVDTRSNEEQPSISPDGRWAAYVSDESGRTEVYVRAFPGGSRPWPISTEGGDVPRWGPGSDEIYFRVGRNMVAATLDFAEGVDVVGLTSLFDTTPFELSGYQAASDGERLLMIREGTGADPGSTVIMLNVFDEIERRLAR